MSDPSSLTDDDLKAMLLKYGVTPGPIVASTRVLYERKLRKLQSEGHNGAENNVRYSDSEEEEDKESGMTRNARTVSQRSQIPAGISKTSSIAPRSGLRSGVVLCLDCRSFFPFLLNFSATPRRPIKGAAQRPVQYAYPDTPVSPVTQERREVERRLVPFKIQIVAFVAVTCVLYLIYVNAEHSGSVMALLESLNQWSD
uniref:LEM domain-containing protein n=1 Tax=Kryptolebias marmoratus TaxID=37003 RepID=A0A3Q3A2R9_KRYMA